MLQPLQILLPTRHAEFLKAVEQITKSQTFWLTPTSLESYSTWLDPPAKREVVKLHSLFDESVIERDGRSMHSQCSENPLQGCSFGDLGVYHEIDFASLRLFGHSKVFIESFQKIGVVVVSIISSSQYVFCQVSLRNNDQAILPSALLASSFSTYPNESARSPSVARM